MASKKEDLHKLAQEARVATRAVVQIHAQGFNDENIRSILDPRFMEPVEWTGSGFFIRIGQERGYILTNAHVARNATNLQIMTLHTSEEMFKAEIIGVVRDMDPDIALLKLLPDEMERFKEIYNGEIPYLELADSGDIVRGMNVKAIGYPLGMVEPNISGGEISNFISGDQANSERIVTDAAINPGNSGGPALVSGGKVAGMNTSIIVDANNIGFITPIDYAKILIDCYMKDQKDATLASLGGSFQKNSKNNAFFLRQEKVEGVIVSEVDDGGMLSRAGITKHDVLIGINDETFDRHGLVMEQKTYRKRNLYDVVRTIPPGEETTLTFLRRGKKMQAQVPARYTPASPVSSQPIVVDRKYLYVFGMIIQELNHEILRAFSQVDPYIYLDLLKEEGSKTPLLVITYISQGKEADEIYLDIGDIITEVNGVKVQTLEDVKKSLAQSLDYNEEGTYFETKSGRIGYFSLKNFPTERLEILSYEEIKVD